MSSPKSSDRITALENELATAKAELIGLQRGRSVRIATFVRQLVASKPKDAIRLLKTAPGLAKRYDPPRVEEFLSSTGYFSSVHNSLPLMRFSNINVATVGKLVNDIFGSTCSTFPLGSPAHLALSKYESAVQVVAIEAGKYVSERHKKIISETTSDHAKLIVLFDKESECAKIKKDFGTKNASYIQKDSLGDFIDIYTLNVKLPLPITDKSIEGFSPSKTLRRDTVLILNSEDIKKAQTNSTLRAKIITIIASGQAVVVKGKKPDWFSREVLSAQDQAGVDKLLSSLSEPYAAERYAIKCSRDTILRNNTLKAAEKALIEAGVIEQLDVYTPNIGIILSTKRPENIPHALSQLEQQTIKPAQVAILLHGVSDSEQKKATDAISKSFLNIETKRVDESVLFGDVLNTGLDMLNAEFASKIDDDDYYSPNHFLDLYCAWMHSRADFVGKWNNWVYLENEKKTINWVPEYIHSYVKHLPGGTFLVKTAVLKNLRFGKVRRAIDSELFRRAERRGATLYSTHRYNYIRKRGDDHTYKTADADFKSRSHTIWLKGLPLEDKLSA